MLILAVIVMLSVIIRVPLGFLKPVGTNSLDLIDNISELLKKTWGIRFFDFLGDYNPLASPLDSPGHN